MPVGAGFAEDNALSADATVVTHFTDTFSYPSGLITNEFAYSNPNNSQSVFNPNWYVTSGSVFAKSYTGWTGVPDDVSPNAKSTNGNHSAVFRMHTRRSNFGSIAVTFLLYNNGFTSTRSTPALSENGVHIFLRRQSETKVYYGSINRRDNTVLIKKKMPGGATNGGTYYTLSKSVPYAIPFRTWQQISATIKDNSDGSVTIKLFANGKLLVSATDKGTGGPPIRISGAVGLRADNDNIQFKNFQVTSIPASLGAADTDDLPALAPVVPMRVYPMPWRADKNMGLPITFDGLNGRSTVRIFTLAGELVTTLPETNLSTNWNLTNDSGENVASGCYVYLVTNDSGDKRKGVLTVIR